MFANFVDRADVGVIQRGSGASLTQEALVGLLILEQLVGQEFEGHAAAQRGVFGLVYHAHAPATQLLDNAIVGNSLAGHGMATRLGHSS